MTDKPTIWALFSVENNYDQPENNLAAWWLERPNIEKLAEFLGNPLGAAADDEVVAVVSIWQGTQTEFGPCGTAYRLEQIKEGGV